MMSVKLKAYMKGSNWFRLTIISLERVIVRGISLQKLIVRAYSPQLNMHMIRKVIGLTHI